MDFSKLRQGELIAGVSAVLLFIFMFFDWYSYTAVEKQIEQAHQFGIPTVGNVSPGISAWDAFDFVDVIMLLAVIAAVGMAFLRMTDNRLNLPLEISSVAAGLGALSTLLVLFRVIDPPLADLDRDLGLFLGLVAAAGVAYGGYRTMQDEGISLQDVQKKLAGAQSGPPEPPF
jgi:hypothetical protein